jgi:4-amino-4-deoxy-L-arabinose transferase-like glycosyltransferase
LASVGGNSRVQAPPQGREPAPRVSRRRLFVLALTVAGAVVASHLVALATAPPGLFWDEAAFGYNGWTISHFGTDQYGTHWPLFFRSFGDYKSPAGVYFEALLTSFLPLTPWVIRLPNALAGIALAFAAGWLGWRLTRSRAIVFILVLEAAFEPWFFHLSRTMLEADLFTPLCYVLALAALAAGGERRLQSCIAAGIMLGAACFTAQPARFFTPALLVIVVFAFRRTLRGVRLAALVVPVALGLIILVAAGNAAIARLREVNAFNGNGLTSGVQLAIGNYFQYLGPVLLFIRGDSNVRHSTGFEGLLFVTAAVPLALGAVAAFRRRSEPLATIALLGTLIAPAGASLTSDVSARRDVVVLPFLLVLLAYGWQALVPWLRRRRGRTAVAGACVLLCAIPYYLDYALVYPNRAAASFEAGGLEAIARSHALAQGHNILVSEELGSDALVVLLPDPRLADPLASVGVHLIASPADIEAAQPGDLLVLTPPDTPPPGVTLLFQEVARGPASPAGGVVEVVLVSVYRR